MASIRNQDDDTQKAEKVVGYRRTADLELNSRGQKFEMRAVLLDSQ